MSRQSQVQSMYSAEINNAPPMPASCQPSREARATFAARCTAPHHTTPRPTPSEGAEALAASRCNLQKNLVHTREPYDKIRNVATFHGIAMRLLSRDWKKCRLSGERRSSRRSRERAFWPPQSNPRSSREITRSVHGLCTRNSCERASESCDSVKGASNSAPFASL